jgi:multidrug resistance efflux pump
MSSTNYPTIYAEIRHCVETSSGVSPTILGYLSTLLAERDALVAAGDVLATRLDETRALEGYTSTWEGLDEKTKQSQLAVRAWLAVAHPNGEGHKP